MHLDSKDPLEFSRFTIFLDAFDKRVITLMAKKRKQSQSGIIRYIIHNWIESYPTILKESYDIDMNNITGEIKIVDHPQVIQDLSQNSDQHSNLKRSSDLSRITFSLDAFDERVINLMAKKRKQSRSETVRNLIHNWVEGNTNILKSNYDIDLNDITREIEITDYNQVIQNTIQKLIRYSELFNEIEFDILAEQLKISRKILRDIIFEHKNKLEKLGVKLRIRGKLIVKE